MNNYHFMMSHHIPAVPIGGLVWASDLWSTDCEFYLPAVHCRVSTVMGDRDRLYAGKPSRYVTGHLGQLSLPSLRGR